MRDGAGEGEVEFVALLVVEGVADEDGVEVEVEVENALPIVKLLA